MKTHKGMELRNKKKLLPTWSNFWSFFCVCSFCEYFELLLSIEIWKITHEIITSLFGGYQKVCYISICRGVPRTAGINLHILKLRWWRILHREGFPPLSPNRDGEDYLGANQLLLNDNLDPSIPFTREPRRLDVLVVFSSRGRGNKKTFWVMNPNCGNTLAVLGPTSSTFSSCGHVEHLPKSFVNLVCLELKREIPLFSQRWNRGQKVALCYLAFFLEQRIHRDPFIHCTCRIWFWYMNLQSNSTWCWFLNWPRHCWLPTRGEISPSRHSLQECKFFFQRCQFLQNTTYSYTH